MTLLKVARAQSLVLLANSQTWNLMPATRLYGRRWHFSSDIIPLPASIAALYYGLWSILIITLASATGCWPKSPCASWQGLQYVIFFSVMLGSFIIACAIDVMLVYHGLKGIWIHSYQCNIGKCWVCGELIRIIELLLLFIALHIRWSLWRIQTFMGTNFAVCWYYSTNYTTIWHDLWDLGQHSIVSRLLGR